MISGRAADQVVQDDVDLDWLLFGDGSGRPLGIFANNVSPADAPRLMSAPDRYTRQQRRADERAAEKRNRR